MSSLMLPAPSLAHKTDPGIVEVRRADLERLARTIDDLYRCFDPVQMSSLIGEVSGIKNVLMAPVIAGIRPQPLALYDPPTDLEPPAEPDEFIPSDEDERWAAENPTSPPNDPDAILAAVAEPLSRLSPTIHSGSIDFTAPNGVEWRLSLENLTLFYAHMEDEARNHDTEMAAYG